MIDRCWGGMVCEGGGSTDYELSVKRREVEHNSFIVAIKNTVFQYVTKRQNDKWLLQWQWDRAIDNTVEYTEEMAFEIQSATKNGHNLFETVILCTVEHCDQ